jgi:di/tricarboxylate transporter
MAFMVGNGAIAGALSPFAPTGIIVSGLMTRMGMPGLENQTYLYNVLGHAVAAFGGYFLFGGLKLFALERVDLSGPADTDDDASLDFKRRHIVTLAAIALLLVSVIAFDVNVGMAAFVGSALLVLFKCADDVEGVKRMPWRVIVMVCGVTVLITLLEKAQGIDLLVSLVARVSTAETVTAVVAFMTGIISVYSSTSGVVLPALLPMVPGLARELGGADPLAIASSMNIGGHLVDVSPLSTIGALCIAGAPAGHDTRLLFNKLLAWGLSMCVVAAALCYVFFG